MKICPLEFEILIDLSLGGEKKPVVNSIKEAAKRTADSHCEDTDISEWLHEADEEARVQRMVDPETRQFKLDETDRLKLEKAAEDAKEEEEAKRKEEEEANKKKKKYGKLPQKQKHMTTSKDSTEAAAKMLRKFFNRR